MDIHLSEEISQDFYKEVKHIPADGEFLKLSAFVHHQWTNRLMHSMNVSYLSWKMAKKFGWDEGAAARAELLHDFCLFDFSQKPPTGETVAFYHPKEAAKNSVRVFQISEKERDAILSHMFPSLSSILFWGIAVL